MQLFETRFIDSSHESKASPVSMFDMLEGTSWDLAEVTIDGVRKSHDKCHRIPEKMLQGHDLFTYKSLVCFKRRPVCKCRINYINHQFEFLL